MVYIVYSFEIIPLVWLPFLKCKGAMLRQIYEQSSGSLRCATLERPEHMQAGAVIAGSGTFELPLAVRGH